MVKHDETRETPQNQIQIQKKESNHRGRETYSDEFEKWWAVYPEKAAKGAAAPAYAKARLSASADDLLAGVTRYIKTKPTDRAWAHPTTWLNQKRWLDQPAPLFQPLKSEAIY